MWYFICWFMKKLSQHLAALNSKHLCSHSFCGSGMQVWLSWVPWGSPGSLTRFSQDAGQDIGVGLISRISWGGFYSQTCSWFLSGLHSSQAVGLTKVLSACCLLARGLPHFPHSPRHGPLHREAHNMAAGFINARREAAGGKPESFYNLIPEVTSITFQNSIY